MDAAGTVIPLAAASASKLANEAGIVTAALLAAGALLAPRARGRALCMAWALVLTPILLIAEIWDEPGFRPVRDRPALAVAGALAGLALVAGGAAAIRRRAELLPLLAVAAVPFRIPIESGGDSANLLVPLYLLVAAGALAYLTAALRGELDERRERSGRLEQLLAAAVVLYAVQATYSSDFSKALQQVVFFYVPFALLFTLLVRVRWTVGLLARCLAVLAGLAVIFTLIGLVEFKTRHLLLNPRVIASNQLESYFRVNSLFFDPNIFGRFLALVMVALTSVLLWTRNNRVALAVSGLLGVLFGGVLMTLSQSSLAALLAGCAVLGALRFGRMRTLGLAAALGVIGVAVVLAFPGQFGLEGKDTSIDRATSGRSELVQGGARLFADHPLQGYGSASFPREFRRAEDSSSERATSASHTIPLTVAAEQGVVGLAIYLALLAAALARLLRGAGESVARAAVGAAFAALLLHTLLYAAFLEDPITWVLLAIGTGLAAGSARTGDPEPA
jgi:O-antigen ligase